MPRNGNYSLVRGLKGNKFGPTSIKKLSSQQIGQILVDMVEPELQKKAKEVHDDLEQKSRQAIDYFYFTYDPMIYDRIGGLRYAFTSNIERIDSGYLVSFTYSPELMRGSHRATNDLIFEQAFMQGFHGGYNGVINAWNPQKNPIYQVPAAQTDPSPWELITNYVKVKYSD